MSANDPTLTPDVPTISEAFNLVYIGMRDMLQYCAAVGSIQTGPQTFDSGGISGTADPFQTLPDFKNAVLTAQSHTYTFFPTVFAPLVEWASSVNSFAQTFSGDAGTILTTIAAIGSQTPTDAQRQQILGAFNDMNSGLAALQSGIQSLQAVLVQFDAWIDADNAALTSGPAAIQAAITNLESWFTSYELQFVGGFGGEGIVNLIGQIEQQFVTPMQNAQIQLQSVIRLSSAVGTDSSRVLDLVSDLVDKCNAVVIFITNADGANLASAVQRIELGAAEAAWTQLGRFVQATI